MVIKQKTIEKIKDIIKKHHKALFLTYMGSKAVSDSVKKELKEAGYDPDSEESESLISRVYKYNYFYPQGEEDNPKDLSEISDKELPDDPNVESSVEYLNQNFRTYIEQMRQDVENKFEAILNTANKEFKFDKLQNPDSDDKDLSTKQLQTLFQDITKDANRNWDRIVNTEVSNAVGLGSLDRIAEENEKKDFKEVYVYKIHKVDAATCPYCMRFYVDSDGSPKLYKLSTLLGNGSNYGRKKSQWQAVSAATHPNCRESQLLELKPGWKLEPGGSVTYIGVDKWEEYVKKKLEA